MHKSIRRVQKKKKRETHTKWGKQYINVPTTDNMPIITVLYLIIRLKELQTQGKNNTNIKMKEYALILRLLPKALYPLEFLESPQLLFMFFILTCTCLDRTCVYLQSVMKMVFS